MSKQLSSLCVILAGVLWGIISIFVNYLSNCGFSSLEICFMRIITCAALLYIFLVIYNKQLLKISLKDIWMFVGTGIISLTLFSLCYFKTIINIEASVAVSLLYTSPVFIMLFSAVLFNEKINFRRVLAIAMTVVGCALVSGFSGADKGISAKSLLIGIGAGLFYALYSIFARYALRKYHPLTITFYTFLFSAVSFTFVITPSGFDHIVESQPKILFVATALGLVCGVLPYLLYTVGLKNLDTSTAGILAAVEPLVGAVVGIVGFKENANLLKIIGILLILSSIVICGIADKKRGKNANAGSND